MTRRKRGTLKGETPGYKNWSNMRARCRNPKHANYSEYGGRGITVCERWDDFDNFRDDMGEPLPGMSLDRIDPDGNYEPNGSKT
jgi:hypothetical protein